MPPPLKADILHGHSHDTNSTTSVSTFDPEKQQQQQQDLPSVDRSRHLPKSPIRMGLLLFGMFLGGFLASLDISIVAAALPHMASDFNAQTEMSWIATAYLLAYTAFQPIYGRFSDIFGRKQMFLVANVLFLVGSIGCGAAPSMIALILFRAVQGFGGSGLFSILVIMVADMFEDIEERARYQSLIWLAFAVSSVTGPLLGGLFVEHATWRWCFYSSIPFGVVCMSLVGWLFNVPFERTNLRAKMRRVDYLGVFFVVVSVLCLLLPLGWGGTSYAWNSPPIIALFVLFVVFAGALIFIEARTPPQDAIIPPILFLNRNVSIALLVNGVMGICFMGITFYMPLYLQTVQGASTTNAGLRMIPSAFALVFSTIASSFLLKKLKDYRIFIWVGTATMTLSIGLFMLMDANTGLGVQLVFVLVMGLGQGLIFQNCLLACQECAGESHMAVATALCGFINSIGSSVGVAICAALFNNALKNNLTKLSPDIQTLLQQLDVVNNMNAIGVLPADIKGQVIDAYADSFQFLFMILTPIMGLSFFLSLFMGRRKIPTTE
ncbi:hypothetical protein BGZ98_010388 [Dissophora globulifera]|nr:hypothetical protein BGZ98_010388 [Dissophora globulifera]